MIFRLVQHGMSIIYTIKLALNGICRKFRITQNRSNMAGNLVELNISIAYFEILVN